MADCLTAESFSGSVPLIPPRGAAIIRRGIARGTERTNVDLAPEEQRIRDAYARRDEAGAAARYRWNRPGVLYDAWRKRACWARALADAGLADLPGIDALDVGCGAGPWLRMLLEWGADPARLHGIDLLAGRIAQARATLPPQVNLHAGSAWPLPFDDASFGLAAASTVFSSILDAGARMELARQMQRVVRPGGWIMIYDFAVSGPRNPDTIGIGRSEIGRLFGGCELRRTYRLTLAPPLRRMLSPHLLWLAHAVEALLPFLRTHRLWVLCNDADKGQ